MGLRRLLLATAILGICQTGWTQSPTYGLGKAPTPDEVRKWDIAISPEGKELPQGHGTAKEGSALYTRKGCAACHGAAGSGAHAPTLISRKAGSSSSTAPAPVMAAPLTPPSTPCLAPCVNDSNTMGIHSPYATTIWDYINRGMPLGNEGSLTPNEVYSLTAFLLYRHDIIKEDEVMDDKSLPKVKMPNRNGAALPEPWKPGEPRLQGYP